MLSYDGSEGDSYQLGSIQWSPDSKKLVAYRRRPGYQRTVYFVLSAPEDQLQPRLDSMFYRKPGDVLDLDRPVLFDVERGTDITIDDGLFPNAYRISSAQWREDGRAFTFEYNQRGHQVYRIIEVDAGSGEARAAISEEVPTFFNYRTIRPNARDSGRQFRHDIDDGREVIWMSERDGWNHLYLYDGVTGEVKNQITNGEWVVRAVDSVDVASRRIWFQASGMMPEQDPYFVHYYRIDFDGSNLVQYTEADGNHNPLLVAGPQLLRRPVLPRRPAHGAGAAARGRPADAGRDREGRHVPLSSPPAGGPSRSSSPRVETGRQTSGA